MQRRFFPFGPGFSSHAARTLLEEHCPHHDEAVDLSGLWVGLPTHRSARAFLSHLHAHAHRVGLRLLPPQVETPGPLVDGLLPAASRPLGGPARELLWMQALQELDPPHRALLTAEPAAVSGLGGWAALARRLDEAAAELAEHDLGFAEVASRLDDAAPDAEHARWEALTWLEAAVAAAVVQASATDPHQWRRRCLREGQVDAQATVLLIGVVDPGGSLRALAGHLGDRLRAWVQAPPALASSFDAMGGLDEDAWAGRAIPLADAQVEVVDAPADQARALSAWWRGGEVAATLALGDEEALPFLREALDAASVRVGDTMGRPIERSALYSLLTAVVGFLRSRRFEDLAALVRQPAVWSHLVQTNPHQDDPLATLDAYAQRHLPDRLSDLPTIAPIEAILDAVAQLLHPLQDTSRSLADWMPRILAWCSSLLSPGPALDSLATVVRAYGALGSGPPLAGHEALELLRRAWSGSRLFEAPDVPADVAVVGWLDLALDASPRVAIGGLQEGSIPAYGEAELFLPDGLRARLGLPDHRRRLARDTYLLTSLLTAGRDVRAVAGRRAASGEPLKPSRLLLAVEGEALARRVLHWTTTPVAKDDHSPFTPGPLDASLQRAPLPEPALAAAILSVTALRDYLACPYRFYLRHVCGLRRRHDHHLELDAASFGSIAHEVLTVLGSESARVSTDAVSLTALLAATLDTVTRRRFGPRPRAAVRVQVAQLRRRLEAVAQWQSERARRGWIVDAVEIELQAALEVDGVAREVRARIDRIDRHRDTGQIAILDYKTADVPRTPQQTHLDAAGQWTDLQLPLYAWLYETRHGAAALPCELAYLVVPRDPWQVAYHIAGWTPKQLAAALDVARQAVGAIHRGKFWPPHPVPPRWADEYAGLCLDDIHRVPPLHDEATA